MPLVILLLALLALVALGLWLVLPGKTGPAQAAAKAALEGRNLAHRGLHNEDKTVPENSLAAFKAAVDAGYGMELDIQLSQDGQVVVFHDDDLKRVCGVEGRVDAYPYSELKEMRIEGTEQAIPLFTELLALVNGKTPLVVELKHGPRNTELCEKALAILEGYDGPYCVESFDPRIVGWFRKNAPHVLRGQLSATAKHLASGPVGLVVGNLLTNVLARPHFIAYRIGREPFLVRFARKRAIKVGWTAQPTDDRAAVEAANDAVIFEHYLPKPKYR